MSQRPGPDWPTPDPDQRTRTGRTSPPGIPPLPTPRGAVIVRPCALAKPATEAVRRNAQEREWKRIEAEIEKPLRDILAEGVTAREALASLDNDVLKAHDWTLSRYLVRVLRELHARSIKEASVEIGDEEYAMRSLDDAHWDGYNAWDVVEKVRAETLDILAWLETARTTDNPRAQQAQSVAERLIFASKTVEPWSVGSDCKQPEDPGPRREITASAE